MPFFILLPDILNKRKDIFKAIGSLQLCAGQDAGSESAIDAVYDVFNGGDTEGF